MKIFLDGPNLKDLKKFKRKVDGFTYNPTLISKLNNRGDYLYFCNKIALESYPKPISLEVISDEEKSMIYQARKLAKLSSNVFVKIPVTFTNKKSTLNVIKILANENVKLNITAVFNLKQVINIFPIINKKDNIISVFAGRLHDMGISAENELKKFDNFKKNKKFKTQILWASTRQIYDYVQAKRSGCSIITMSKEIFEKKVFFKSNWSKYSLDTVKQFYKDAKKSKFKI